VQRRNTSLLTSLVQPRNTGLCKVRLVGETRASATVSARSSPKEKHRPLQVQRRNTSLLNATQKEKMGLNKWLVGGTRGSATSPYAVCASPVQNRLRKCKQEGLKKQHCSLQVVSRRNTSLRNNQQTSSSAKEKYEPREFVGCRVEGVGTIGKTRTSASG
jgi:hypothetical protein